MCSLPGHRNALREVRQPDAVGVIGTSQSEIRTDDLQLRLVRNRRELPDGHIGAASGSSLLLTMKNLSGQDQVGAAVDVIIDPQYSLNNDPWALRMR
jgi:hypothetical protein